MKKITFIVGLVAFSTIVRSQTENGLEKIIVEKYYVSNAADAAGSKGVLPVGSITYRVYADMLPGYRFQAMYGDVNHTLKFGSTTSFFNNEERGQTNPDQILSTNLKNNTVALDSWFSVGAAANEQFGVLKTEDDGVENLLPINSNLMLKNTTPLMGLALNVQDGIITGTPETVSFVGLSQTDLAVFKATSQKGNSFSTNTGAISALNGAQGPTVGNRILLGQFTTDGDFSFELNIQIGTPTPGVSQNYVANNPTGNEISIPSLILVPNIAPSISVSAPSTANVGDVIKLEATASDLDGTIAQVEFFVDDASVGIATTSPYTKNWTAVVGPHTIKAIATDNQGSMTTSTISSISVNVVGNNAPSINLIAPTTAVKNDIVALSATATDSDGTITQVEFFVDDVSIEKVSTSPYTANWTALSGSHTIKAIATDNLGSMTTSSISTIEVQLVGLNKLTTSNFSVNVSPNPAKDFVTINMINLQNNQNTIISIFDFKGSLISSTTTSVNSNDFNYKLDVSSIKSGVYFMNISSGIETIIEKIVIE
jgi:chitodextrinase